jgi:hypothetical protein
VATLPERIATRNRDGARSGNTSESR